MIPTSPLDLTALDSSPGPTVLVTLLIDEPGQPQPEVARLITGEVHALASLRLFRPLAYALLPGQLQLLIQLPLGGRASFDAVLSLLKTRTSRKVSAFLRHTTPFWTTHHAVLFLSDDSTIQRVRDDIFTAARSSTLMVGPRPLPVAALAVAA